MRYRFDFPWLFPFSTILTIRFSFNSESPRMTDDLEMLASVAMVLSETKVTPSGRECLQRFSHTRLAYGVRPASLAPRAQNALIISKRREDLRLASVGGFTRPPRLLRPGRLRLRRRPTEHRAMPQAT